MVQAGEIANNGYVMLARALIEQSLRDINSPEPTNGWESRNWPRLRFKIQAEAIAWWQSDEPRFWCQAAGYNYDNLATRLWQILEEA